MKKYQSVLERYLDAVQQTDNAFGCWQYQRAAFLRDLENAPLSVTADTAKAIKQIDELLHLLDNFDQ